MLLNFAFKILLNQTGPTLKKNYQLNNKITFFFIKYKT